MARGKGAYLGYDAAGRLLFTSASGASFTYFDYDGDKMIHERANGGDDGLGGYMPLAMALPTATVGTTQLAWMHPSHMGVPIVYTNAAGTTIPAPTGFAAPGFPGQNQTTADLYYNRHRDYDPGTGRYIQADPIGLAGGPSPYSYAMGNPIRYMDPTGEFVPIVIAGLCGSGGCEALALLGVAGLGYAGYEWYAHPPAGVPGALSPNRPQCIFHRNRSGGGYGGGIGGFGNPPMSDYDPGDQCDVEYEKEMQYCSRKYGVSPSQYGQCASRAGTNLALCKSGGSSLGWWTDEHMDGVKTPQRPSPKRRRW